MAIARTDRLTVLRYDVFTDRAYAGNPLALAIEPPPLSDAQMQRIASHWMTPGSSTAIA